MASLLSNVCSMQMQILDQWYKSFDFALRNASGALDTAGHFFTTGQGNSRKLSGNTQTGRTDVQQIDKKTKTGIAVVTGGIGGIGTEICRRLATDGNIIIATHIAAEKDKAFEWKTQMENEGFRAEIHECNVADFESCRQFAETIEARHGQIDILVNAAGITRDAMLRKMDPANWHSVIETNLDSVFNVTRQFINSMLRNGYGRIINISSVNGQKGQFGQTNYSTAKAGMIGFTRSLALELADKGITVNCVCPGYVKTSMVAAIREDVLQSIINQIPAGRLATTTEIADAVAFLASEGSGYITGTELAVNGGLWLG